MSSPRVVVVCGDPVAAVMAGPAIRAVELARALVAAGHPVTVAAPDRSDHAASGVPVRVWATREELAAIVAEADVIVVFAPVLADHLWMADLGCPLVVDAYDPGLLETLESRRGDAPNAQRDWVADASRHLMAPLAVADVVLVASERQRLLVLGMLSAAARLSPRVVAEDPGLDAMVRIVPFGLPEEPPDDVASPLRWPLGPFDDDSFVALWGGGLYPWLDPLTLIEAVGRIPDARIGAAFLAGPHPTPAVGAMPLVEQARRRVAELGLHDRVIFVDHWVPYAERGAWLVGADVGVSLHHRHVETELSFRTRVLDYLWAGLPVLCSAGDVMAEDVAALDLGTVVDPGDVDAVAGALVGLAAETPADREARRSRTAAEGLRRRWSVVTGPLVAACADPSLAPDRRVAESQARGPVGALRRAVRVARSAGT